MAEGGHIFFDQRGTRRQWVRRLGAIAGTGFAVVTSLFILSLLATPALGPRARGRTPFPHALETSYSKALAQHRARADRSLLQREIATSKKRATGHIGGTAIVMAFYEPWEPTALSSFIAHANQLTDVAPTWLHLADDGASLDFRDYVPRSNPGNTELIAAARARGVRILPVLDNSDAGRFDSKRLAQLLTDPAKRDKVVAAVTNWLVSNRFDGVNVDFEELPDGQESALLTFLRELKTSISSHGLSLSADIQSGLDATNWAEFADTVDWAVLMAYDQHSDDTRPGSIAGIPWTEAELGKILETFPEEKLVLGIGNYGYDWAEGSPRAESVSFQDALSEADGFREEPPKDVIEFDSDSLNSHFDYEDDKRKSHHVWFLDALSAYNQVALARDAGVRGVALWALGVEDPSLWTFFDRDMMVRRGDAKLLDTLRFPYEVAFVGKGEVLDVRERPKVGMRKVSLDADTGLIDEAAYLKYGFPYVLGKSGYKPKKLVLTFDDGPDPTFTPEILDALKRLHCPATFFVIGQSAERNPSLVQRMVSEGHEVGNHSYTHPNLGRVGERRAELELNATQRAIEGLTGRSTELFRPPYNADSMPETQEQILPVDVASRMSYITVGENVDPHDWDTTQRGDDGTSRPKTGEDIAAAIIGDIQMRQGTDNEGNIILLHDAGGDRHATVDALPILIPRLRTMGYTFVTVAGLLGKSEAQVMPPIPVKDRAFVGLDRITFAAAYTFESFLAAAFVLAIGLGIIRSLAMVPLAVAYMRRRPKPPPGSVTSAVSVAIAAYNEEPVILRTITSVLRSEYPVSQVIVVDDGSTDGTAQAVRERYGCDPRVQLLAKENGGKAQALNVALQSASGDLILGVDADTQLDSGAIGRLVAHFENPEVGAVAGNVEVGNVRNVLTLWQSIEYTSTQNLDRRAFALLNAVTVVPGAIGMWRRTALEEVDGYAPDTLAEDMDLTWRIRQRGYRIETEPSAKAYTEAPETFGAFFRQRFRWAFGTLQCLWKHRRSLGRYGWFGRFALPCLWLFQIVFQALAPLIDLQVIYSLAGAAYAFATTSGSSVEMETRAMAVESLMKVAFLYGVFFTIELCGAIIAFRMERRPIRSLGWLFLQRFVYRQIMYGVIYRSIARAISGGRQGWSKLARTGNVTAR